jgi:hypothetical protein
MIRNSLGIWALGPNVTRFVPPGYHPGATQESMVERTRRAADGLHAGQKPVYAALGMDSEFESTIVRRRQQARV